MKHLLVFLVIVVIHISLNSAFSNIPVNRPIKVLALSGNNNHDWQSTTLILEKMYSENGLFTIETKFKPDTLKAQDLSRYDVIVSNWNSWPDNEVRWPSELEKALVRFIRRGGGFVTFHASTSVFYKWPEFKKISTSSWVTDSTWHGKNSETIVKVNDNMHPVTQGMKGFYIFDELWIGSERNRNFITLASATNKETLLKGIGSQPAAGISRYGRGRIFHTILGHDARAMRNTGFRTIMLRGTEWAATGKVTQVLPQELSENKNTGEEDFNWQKTDTTVSLLKGKRILWKYNYNTKHGRPFFHPVYAGNNRVTCVSPDDHPWHLGQWFCWKYINGVNYWEYVDRSFRSEGITDIQNIGVKTNPDFSAEISLEIAYRPENGKHVLSEVRTINVSPPQENGNIWMDYDLVFRAISDTVLLDRTPIEGEPGGQSWGGYAGLSVRYNQDFMDSHFITSWQNDTVINGQAGDWLYMGFKGTEGNRVGSQIMIAPHTVRDGAAWYSVNTNDLPFHYFSPAYLYKKPLTLLKNETIHLGYRVLHVNGETNYFMLNQEFLKFQKDLKVN